MATFHFDLVSPEKLLFSGDVEQVDVPGVEGDFGVLANHAPFVATLRPGILTVHGAGGAQKIVVLGDSRTDISIGEAGGIGFQGDALARSNFCAQLRHWFSIHQHPAALNLAVGFAARTQALFGH